MALEAGVSVSYYSRTMREQIEARVFCDEVITLRPDYPTGLRGRNRERWAPLLKVATVAGGAWLGRCLALIETDLGDQNADREAGIQKLPRHVQLLKDIAEVWPADESFMHTTRMVDALQNYRPDWWGVLNQFGKLTAQGMGGMLSSHFNIRSSQLTKATPDGRRGYYQQSFLSSWCSFGVSVPTDTTLSGEPITPNKLLEPGKSVTGLSNKTGVIGSPETPTDTGIPTEKQAQAVTDFLVPDGGLSPTIIADSLHLSVETVTEICQALTELGTATVDTHGNYTRNAPKDTEL